VLTFSNDGLRYIITRQGGIKDCWFFLAKTYIAFFITITLALLSESNGKKEVAEKIKKCLDENILNLLM